jgi:hypothetical protein
MTEQGGVRVMVFTFDDRETGDIRSIIAQNEDFARMRLGGIWDDNADRTPARPPRDVADLHAVREEALKAERDAFQAWQTANPVGKSRYATTDQLDAFASRKQIYEKLKAHRQELEQIIASLR